MLAECGSVGAEMFVCLFVCFLFASTGKERKETITSHTKPFFFSSSFYFLWSLVISLRQSDMEI